MLFAALLSVFFAASVDCDDVAQRMAQAKALHAAKRAAFDAHFRQPEPPQNAIAERKARSLAAAQVVRELESATQAYTELSGQKTQCDREARAAAEAADKVAAEEAKARQLREQQEQEEAAAKVRAERDARIETMLKKPKTMQAVWSTLRCDEKAQEAEALARIKEVKEASKIAGVVDLRELKELQDQVVYARKLVKSYERELRLSKATTLGCKSKEVESLNVLRNASLNSETDGFEVVQLANDLDYLMEQHDLRRQSY